MLKIIQKIRFIIAPLVSFFLVIGFVQPAMAFYRMPVSVTPSQEDLEMGCIELEREIAAQVPLTYSYKPDFYQDPYQGASIIIGTMITPVAYSLSAVSAIGSLVDRTRIEPAEERITLLRQLKAQKHCFE
ncbi:MAG: hypothetical protein GY703_08910 [Gammaproteobacteria bacterium]|nr:hypothetical protein [Gammaproteobacteria bacterium]